jgi:hypothetical protein
MRTLVLAGLFTVIMAVPALAAGEEYYLIKDTVGNCAAVISSGGAPDFPGMTVVSKKSYPSLDAANSALGSLPSSDCSGIVK